jgi:repressor LexA
VNTKPARKETILNYIKQFQAAAGYPPTIVEIGQALGLAKTTVHYHLGKLIMEGRLERVASSARAIRVL